MVLSFVKKGKKNGLTSYKYLKIDTNKKIYVAVELQKQPMYDMSIFVSQLEYDNVLGKAKADGYTDKTENLKSMGVI